MNFRHPYLSITNVWSTIERDGKGAFLTRSHTLSSGRKGTSIPLLIGGNTEEGLLVTGSNQN